MHLSALDNHHSMLAVSTKPVHSGTYASYTAWQGTVLTGTRRRVQATGERGHQPRQALGRLEGKLQLEPPFEGACPVTHQHAPVQEARQVLPAGGHLRANLPAARL